MSLTRAFGRAPRCFGSMSVLRTCETPRCSRLSTSALHTARTRPPCSNHTCRRYAYRQYSQDHSGSVINTVENRLEQPEADEWKAEEEDTDVSTEPTPAFALRPYQEAAIGACLDALDKGITRMGVSSPTGSGKTTIFMRLIPEVVEREGRRKKTLVIVSSVELADQSANAARRLLGDDWDVELEQGKHKATGLADVTVATYQSLSRAGRMDKYDPRDYGLVIIDEAHHAAAKSYAVILQHFNQDVVLPGDTAPIVSNNHGHRVPLVGFSATFSRPDMLALNSVFEKIVFHRDIRTMLKEGWLSPASLASVKANLDLAHVSQGQRGDFITSELSEAMDQPETNQLIVRSYLSLAKDRRSTLIFCVDLRHVDSLTSVFRQAGIDARYVTSMSKPAHRRETLQAFLNGEFPILINCEVLTEGADIPTIDCIILARPTKSRNLLAQMVGRGLRLSPDTGKTDCFIIDIVDGASQGFTVSPTLLGLSSDVHSIAREKGDDDAHSDEEAPASSSSSDAEPRDRRYNVTFNAISDPFGVEEEGVKQKSIIRMSQFAWVPCGRGRYVLQTRGREYVKVEPSEESNEIWDITIHEAPPTFWEKKTLLKPRLLGQAETAERALQAADLYLVSTNGPDASKYLRRDAPWRKRPATDKQLEMIFSLKGVQKISAEDSADGRESVQIWQRILPMSQLTQGTVSSILTGHRRGASSLKQNSLGRQQRQEERKRQKELKERGGLELPEES